MYFSDGNRFAPYADSDRRQFPNLLRCRLYDPVRNRIPVARLARAERECWMSPSSVPANALTPFSNCFENVGRKLRRLFIS